MAEIQFPGFPTPSQDEWKYYLSFGTPQDYLHEIARALQEDNRFFTDFRFLKLLYWYAKRPKEHEVAKHILLAGQVLYRARIYDVQHDKCEKNSAFQGYGEKDSFIPPDHNSVPEGRINPARIKYLYTAYSIPTAIAEVSPFMLPQPWVLRAFRAVTAIAPALLQEISHLLCGQFRERYVP